MHYIFELAKRGYVMESTIAAVIGGGPAGLQAAITLAKKGVETIVFEKKSTIGLPIQCGEGLSINAFDDFSLPKGDKSFCVRELDTCHLLFPENNTILGDIKAFMIQRDKFDQFLANQALDLGVKIHTSKEVIDIKQNKEGSVVKFRGKNTEYKANYVVLAEGPLAKLAEKIGFKPPSPMIKAFEYKIKGEWSDKLEFHFDSEKYPYGYCWVFPRDGETNVGIVTIAKDRKARLDNFLKGKKIQPEIINKVGGQIPMNGPVQKMTKSNIVITGDTAGMINPIFYGGIRLAMKSGQIAGETIVNHMKSKLDNSNFTLDKYEAKLNEFKFMKGINLKCHKFFYSRNNKFLTKLGEVFNNMHINRIEGLEIVKTLGKLLVRPSLLVNPVGLYRLYVGFIIARDWGF